MNGPWIQTYSGVVFPLLEPEPKHVWLADIAHALSHLCRFTGHVREFYSVAQHSVLVSLIVPPEHALQALLHDAPEAYIGDLNRPLKHAAGIEAYREIEERIWLAVAAKFGVSAEISADVKFADNTMLFTERRDLMGDEAQPWQGAVPPSEIRVRPLSPIEARRCFLSRFYALTQGTERSDG